jgi:hypothetical protein
MYLYEYDQLQKAEQHVEETTITLIIVHKVETKFYINILIRMQ